MIQGAFGSGAAGIVARGAKTGTMRALSGGTMEYVTWFIDFFLHLDKHLDEIVRSFGNWAYGILFMIIFCETGLVVTPILPGDSLLFATGAMCALGSLDVWWCFVLLSLAAVLGDTVNYWIGHMVGPKVFSSSTSRFWKKDHLDRTPAF
jgi:membrane-associated protein